MITTDESQGERLDEVVQHALIPQEMHQLVPRRRLAAGRLADRAGAALRAGALVADVGAGGGGPDRGPNDAAADTEMMAD